ncbi:50S ribosomal protein L23 [Buchnera aphidicola (Anoecia oenotherae)]|uniref:Large ribosomal subunit protein uL23 n=2 Tax=Buchnera aphidicola TaxID=9 RepID=A0A4D6Y111_9GAMM|nr:50S ribosomal protein L23 [Buchnera aphidicola]QCI19521.1 50S ribosomal protein L23 [Buchnera aphidicola (Anoecia oenotherae)]
MIMEERLLNIILSRHISEKSTISAEKKNTIVLKVLYSAKKYEIKKSVEKLFSVQVDSVNTLIVKRKKKGHGQKIGFRKKWKKAFVTIKKGQKLDLIDSRK